MNYKDILKGNIRTVEDIERFIKLSDTEKENIGQELIHFPMSVTEYYMGLIDPNDPNDPIRKMAIPSGEPFDICSMEGVLDTSGEKQNTKFKGIQHKYKETLLVLTTSDCAMYCRHCFRRRLVGIGGETTANINSVVEYIKSHPEVNNVLLSGGDSFMLETDKIRDWVSELCKLDQLDFIRFGTRTPVTFPQRINGDRELLDIFTQYGAFKQFYVVTHFNHPKEFTDEAKQAITNLQNSGVIVKNQTVLMKGINNGPKVLGQVLKKVSSWGIVQHYIFQCRPVMGVKSKFQVPLKDGVEIVRQANAMQNGLGKSADYTLSHVSGKIRVLGELNNELVFQYKQAKREELIGEIFTMNVGNDAWLPEDLNI